MREFLHTVTTPDGIRLAVREYLPDVVTTRRSLLVVHGACEHGGRYVEFSQAATDRGWRVLVPDHRGHGLSTGVRVHVGTFDEYVDDLRLLGRHFSLDPRQSVVVGHSMGGLIVARLLQSPGDRFAACCLLSPFLGQKIHVDRFTLLLGHILLRIWPSYRFRSRVRSVDISHDQDYLEQRKRDPLLQRSVTAGWFFAVQQAIQQVHADAARFQLPVLIMQGDQDHIIDPVATQEWFQIAGSTDKVLDMLPDHLHELLHEPDRTQTARRILDWLEQRVIK